MHVLVNEKKLEEMFEESVGFCIECGDRSTKAEPDAVNVRCECCGSRSVVGVEVALTHGWIIPSNKRYPMLEQYRKGEQ